MYSVSRLTEAPTATSQFAMHMAHKTTQNFPLTCAAWFSKSEPRACAASLISRIHEFFHQSHTVLTVTNDSQMTESNCCSAKSALLAGGQPLGRTSTISRMAFQHVSVFSFIAMAYSLPCQRGRDSPKPHCKRIVSSLWPCVHVTAVFSRLFFTQSDFLMVSSHVVSAFSLSFFSFPR